MCVCVYGGAAGASSVGGIQLKHIVGGLKSSTLSQSFTQVQVCDLPVLLSVAGATAAWKVHHSTL